MQLDMLHSILSSEEQLPQDAEASIFEIISMASSQIAYLEGAHGSASTAGMESSCYTLGLILYSVLAAPAVREAIFRASANLLTDYPEALAQAGSYALARYSPDSNSHPQMGIVSELALLLLSTREKKEAGTSAARYLVDIFARTVSLTIDTQIETLADLFSKYPALLFNGADRTLRDLLKSVCGANPSPGVREYVESASLALDQTVSLQQSAGGTNKLVRAANACKQILTSCLRLLRG